MIISNKIKKARKNYKCDLSGRMIEIGSKYVLVAQKVENEFFSIRVHSDAWALVMSMWDSAGNAIEECLDEETYNYLKYG